MAKTTGMINLSTEPAQNPTPHSKGSQSTVTGGFFMRGIGAGSSSWIIDFVCGKVEALKTRLVGIEEWKAWMQNEFHEQLGCLCSQQQKLTLLLQSLKNSIKTTEKKVDDLENNETEKRVIQLIERMKMDREQEMISVNSRIDRIEKRLSNVEEKLEACCCCLTTTPEKNCKNQDPTPSLQ